MPWLDRNWHHVVLRTSTRLGLTRIPGRRDLNAPYPKGDSPEAAGSEIHVKGRERELLV